MSLISFSLQSCITMLCKIWLLFFLSYLHQNTKKDNQKREKRSFTFIKLKKKHLGTNSHMSMILQLLLSSISRYVEEGYHLKCDLDRPVDLLSYFPSLSAMILLDPIFCMNLKKEEFIFLIYKHINMSLYYGL